MIEIDNADDRRLDSFRDLKQAGETRWNRPLIAEGHRVVKRALALNWPVESLLVSAKRLQAEEIAEIVAIAESRGVLVWCVPQAVAESLAGFSFHAGVLAHLHRPRSSRFETWVEGIAEQELMVAFPEMTDPENVGLLMRSAAAFGVQRVLVGTASADPMGRRALRLSMGAGLKLQIFRTSRFDETLERLRLESGFRVAAAVCDPDATSVSKANLTGRWVLVLGNESRGLSAAQELAADLRLTIPISSGIDSLNVTTAAAVLLYELTRTRFG